MEQKKRFSAFDIINICILGIGVILAFILIFVPIQTFDDVAGKIITVIAYVATLAALFSAAFYMITRYTKNSAALYKVFMYSFVAVAAMVALITMTIGSGSMLNSILIIVILLLSVMLATAKDCGKVKTFIIAGLLLIAHIILCLSISGSWIILCLINLILTAEACIMVLAKYQDKVARGAK